MVLYPSGLRAWSAKPSFSGSNPLGTFFSFFSVNFLNLYYQSKIVFIVKIFLKSLDIHKVCLRF